MSIDLEIDAFDREASLLHQIALELAGLQDETAEPRSLFLAEAATFRLYRIYERLTRTAFLHFCVEEKTKSGAEVRSKLRCDDWNTAEEILKSGNRFLDWGSAPAVQKVSDLVFENGFPIRDLLAPIYSDLVDLQKFRNYITHDSNEAASGFKKSRQRYVRLGDNPPETVGALALYRKGARHDITLMIIHSKISSLSKILLAL